MALISDKEGEPDPDYYLLTKTIPPDKEEEPVLMLVNLYQEAKEGNSSSSSGAGEDSFKFDPSSSSRAQGLMRSIPEDHRLTLEWYAPERLLRIGREGLPSPASPTRRPSKKPP